MEEKLRTWETPADLLRDVVALGEGSGSVMGFFAEKNVDVSVDDGTMEWEWGEVYFLDANGARVQFPVQLVADVKFRLVPGR